MAETNIEVRPNLPEGWLVKEAGDTKYVEFPTRQLAESYARDLAQAKAPSVLTIYSILGALERKLSYERQGQRVSALETRFHRL
jgi:hypothetical protein